MAANFEKQGFEEKVKADHNSNSADISDEEPFRDSDSDSDSSAPTETEETDDHFAGETLVQEEALDVMDEDDTTVNEEDANRILDMLAEMHVPDQVPVFDQEQVQEQVQVQGF